MFITTQAYQKISRLNKRIRGISGGTSASKTISILQWLIDFAQTNEHKVISVVSESMPHLRKGAMRDFLNIMKEHNYFKDSHWNKTESTYTFETGTIIEFFGVESWEKVKGARRDILFINEANHITYETYTQLEVRTKGIIWLDWNPEMDFWFYSDVKHLDNVDFLTLTYKDNEGLDENIIRAIEARKGNKNWWQVYGLGQLGVVEGRIYRDWAIIDEIPHQAQLKRYGLDFGYSNDPTAIVAIYYYNGGYILDEITYLNGLVNVEIADILKNITPAMIKADSAEPKSIEEIKRYGLNIQPAKKGKDSVKQGIQYVQGQRISVTKRSLNLLKEYRNYLWQTDKEGKIINEPQEFLNHLMDAIRYGFDGFSPTGYKMPGDVGGVRPFFEKLPG
jgi:phage terminase large subunit